MTVYIDSLFFTNFFMDTAIFVIISMLRRQRASTVRIFLGSSLSALYGTLIFFPNLSFLYSIAAKAAASAMFVAVVFGIHTIRAFIRSLAAFWFISAAAGGVIFAASTMTSLGNVMQTMMSNGVMYVNISPFLLGGGCAALYALAEIYRRMCAKSVMCESAILDIEVTYLGGVYNIRGLIDTGCSLTEPLSGAPAIVAERRVFCDIPKPQMQMPVNTAGGSCMLDFILPEKLVCTNKRYSMARDAVIVLTENRFSSDGLYNAVINPAAAEEKREHINIEERTKCCNE